MKLYPPPVMNNQVTADMLHWVTCQPNTVMFNTVTSEFTITPGKGAQDYFIHLTTRFIMLRELEAILSCNSFKCTTRMDSGKLNLKVSKNHWSIEIPEILEQMPFSDNLPIQISRAYECWKYEQDNLNRVMSYELSKPQYNLYTDPYPSRERLEEVRRIVEDSIDDNDKD